MRAKALHARAVAEGDVVPSEVDDTQQGAEDRDGGGKHLARIEEVDAQCRVKLGIERLPVFDLGKTGG